MLFTKSLEFVMPDTIRIDDIEQVTGIESIVSRLLFSNPLPCCVMAFPHMEIKTANNAFLSFLGYGSGDFPATYIEQSGIWENPVDRRKLANSLVISGPCLDYKIRLRASNGEIRETICSISPERIDGIIHVLAIFLDAERNTRAEEELKKRLKAEEALARISRLLVESPEPDFDEVLRILRDAIKTDRAYIFRLNNGGKTMCCSHEQSISSGDKTLRNLGEINLTQYQWLLTRISSKQAIVVSNIEALPDSAKAEKEAWSKITSSKSLFVAPIIIDNEEIAGFVGFDDINKAREWSIEDARILGVASSMIAGFLARKRAEDKARIRHEQLVLADKMRLLSNIVAGTAHEVNNPAYCIMGNAEVLQRLWQYAKPVFENHAAENGDFKLGEFMFSEIKDDILKMFSAIIDSTQQIRNIIGELSDFARYRPPEENADVNMNTVVKSATALLSNTLKKLGDRFNVSYDEGIPIIKGDFQRLQHAVVSLLQSIIFSYDSTNYKIEIRTQYERRTRSLLIFFCILRDDDSSPVSRISFDFKESGISPFLGMYISEAIVKSHGGNLNIDDTSGSELRVTMSLPEYIDFSYHRR